MIWLRLGGERGWAVVHWWRELCNGQANARTFEGNARVLRALNALFDNAQLWLRQLLAVGGESALVLLVDRQALP